MARIKNKAVRKLEEKLYKERKKQESTARWRYFHHYNSCDCDSCREHRRNLKQSCQAWVGKEVAIDFGDFRSGRYHKTAYGIVLRYGFVNRAPSGQHTLQVRMLVTKIIDSEGHVEEWWPGLIRHYYGTPKEI